MKYSRQRETVLECVKNACNHPTADQIYEQVKQKIPNISLGTVYRNLNVLIDLGLVKKVNVPTDSDRFDKSLKNHNHIHCINCHKVEDIPLENIENIYQNIEKATNYKLLSYDIVLEGICHSCQKKKGREIYGIKRK